MALRPAGALCFPADFRGRSPGFVRDGKGKRAEPGEGDFQP
jgi:hypothetical protein